MDAIKAVAVDGKVFLYTVFYLCKKKKKILVSRLYENHCWLTSA